MMHARLYGWGLIGWLALALGVQASEPPGWAIASAHPLATQAGEEILQAGGNAFDAAVAVTAALAVVEPSGSGLGGGGFFLLHEAKTQRKRFIDAREVAPLAASADMYLDAKGEVERKLLTSHPMAAGIPGVPAALDHLAKQYGRLSLAESMAPAIRYAKEGFAVDAKLAKYIQFRAKDIAQWPATAAIFMPEGQGLAVGDILQQNDLAATLERIAVFGAPGFYKSAVAERMVNAVRDVGGIWSLKDLAQYELKERMPVIVEHRGWQIVTAPPPSSGGLVLGIMFNILKPRHGQAKTLIEGKHVAVEAMRRAYFDRARFMGDADFVEIPSRGLLSRDYGTAWSATIDPEKATKSGDLGSSSAQSGQGENTTHFSIIDDAGNRVAATLSINYMLGSTFIAPGTGVILNNEMDDFVAKPGEPNGYGLVGGTANAIEPGKRMLSSMTPTFVEGADRIGIVGTPGGSRIISMVFHAINGIIDGQSAKTIVSEPRYHHQYLPDEIQYEPGAFSNWELKQLRLRGHQLKEMNRQYGNMQLVIWDMKKNSLDAASDPRGVGAAKIGRPVTELNQAPLQVPEAFQ